MYGSFREYVDRTSKASDIKFTDPVFCFIPSVAATSLIEIESFNKKWKGDLLMEPLKAMSLFLIKCIEGRVVYSEPIDLGYRIRDVKEVNQKIFILTDQSSLLEISDVDSKINKNPYQLLKLN